MASRRRAQGAHTTVEDEQERKRTQFAELRRRREALRGGTSTPTPQSTSESPTGTPAAAAYNTTPFSSLFQQQQSSYSTQETEPDIWRCEVFTGDLQHAGTKSNVYLDIYGEHGCVPRVHLNRRQEKFPRDSRVEIDLQLDNDKLGRLYKVRVTHDHSGTGPDWYLSRLVLIHVSGPNVVRERFEHRTPEINRSALLASLAGTTDTHQPKPLPTNIAGEHYVFDCDAWLTNHTKLRELPARGPYVDASIAPKLVTYTLKTFTGKGEHKAGAGTDAKVYAQIFGTLGDTGVRQLTHSETHSDKFEEGHEDRFRIDAVNVGDITKVVIGHDNSGSLRHKMHGKGGAGWYLDKVVVYDPTRPGDVTFPCDRWLDSTKDDGKIERELVPAQANAHTTESYVIETATRAKGGSKEGIAGPPYPWVELGGSKGKTSKLTLEPAQGRQHAFVAGARDAFSIRAPGVGALKTVTIGYQPVDGGRPWLPQTVWVTCGGQRTCWVIDGARAETGGTGWPNQRTLVRHKSGDGVKDAQTASPTKGQRPGSASSRGRPHSVKITPTGLTVECWQAAERSPVKRGEKGVDCWNRDFVPSKTRKSTSGKDKSSKRLPFDVLQVKVKGTGEGLGFEVGAIGPKGAPVLSIKVGGAADGLLRQGDVIRLINKRHVSELSADELKRICQVAQDLDLEVVRRHREPQQSATTTATSSLFPHPHTGTATAPPASLSGHGMSATFRDAEDIKRAKQARKERDNAKALRTLLIDVPTAARDDFAQLKAKMKTLQSNDKASVYALMKQGQGHTHARKVWNLILSLEREGLIRDAKQLDQRRHDVEAASAAVADAASAYDDAMRALTLATDAEAHAASAKKAADADMINDPQNHALQRVAVDRGTEAMTAKNKLNAAKAAEKKRRSTLTDMHAALKRAQQAAERAVAAKHAVGDYLNADADHVDPRLAAAATRVAQAKRGCEHADAAQRSGAIKHANDKGIFPVAEAVHMAQAELTAATKAYDELSKAAAKTAARAARAKAITSRWNASDTSLASVGTDNGGGLASDRAVSDTLSVASGSTKTLTKTSSMSETTRTKLCEAILEVSGHSKTALLSVPELHESLLEAGYRKYSQTQVSEALSSEPLAGMVEAQRRRKQHNAAAVKKWERTKRKSTRRQNAMVRSERIAKTQEARDINTRSMARVHYNPWAAAIGPRTRGGVSNGQYMMYEPQSTLRWDVNERRTLGGVSHQSWYHGAKQVAEATEASRNPIYM
eukprot:m.193599 g.193599  ORF g.193599 m.193599 type:complete len:1249 (-) comp18962_c0_seq1:9-3755(-)